MHLRAPFFRGMPRESQDCNGPLLAFGILSWRKGLYMHTPYPSWSTSCDARLAVMLLVTTTPKCAKSVLHCSLTGQPLDSQIRLFQGGLVCVPSVLSQPIWQSVLQCCDSTCHKVATQRRKCNLAHNQALVTRLWRRVELQFGSEAGSKVLCCTYVYYVIIEWLSQQQGGMGCVGCQSKSCYSAYLC